MRILLVHNFLKMRGGSDRCFLSLQTLLEKKGHVVFCFTAEKELGLIDFKLTNAFSYLYNRRAAQKILEVIKNFKPDLAHCHNIYGHLTPSILPVLKKQGVPVVMTLHDSKLICPNHHLFTQHALCERCQGKHFYHAFANCCFKDSFPRSFLGMTEAYLHKALQLYEKNVGLFISPSHFLKRKFVASGWSADRIQVLSNFVDVPKACSTGEAPKGIIYFGGLNEVKGVPLLLQALRLISEPIDVSIFGEGPDGQACQRFASSTPHRVRLGPFQHSPELYQRIQSALFTVVPSACYENQPLSILESYALSRAALGANHGGIPEVIEEGKTGFLFKAGDAKHLAEKICDMLKDPRKTLEMGKRGQEKFKMEFAPDTHYDQLISIYQKML
ncbi:MAG: glycosyltransferase [Deltaproteobacteria bacterium]|nr:glycosyltransferase [Deltaproteobacteria bacterium]